MCKHLKSKIEKEYITFVVCLHNRLFQYLTREKLIKFLGFGGSMVARLKLKGIDGRAHQEWSLRLNLTQHGETYQGQIVGGLTD